jgi:hypothetical protein
MAPLPVSYRRKTDAIPVDGIKWLHLRVYFDPEYACTIRLADSRMPDIQRSRDLTCDVLNASTGVKRVY